MRRGSRMFVAVIPPDEVLADLETFLEPRVDADPDLRWSRPEQRHLTLAFLPSVAAGPLERLEERLDDLAAQTEAFDLTLRGGGAFPGAADARVLWLGVDDPLDGLVPLARRCRSAANAAGTQVEGGAIRPHLTLARLRWPKDVRRWLEVLDLRLPLLDGRGAGPRRVAPGRGAGWASSVRRPRPLPAGLTASPRQPCHLSRQAPPGCGCLDK